MRHRTRHSIWQRIVRMLPSFSVVNTRLEESLPVNCHRCCSRCSIHVRPKASSSLRDQSTLPGGTIHSTGCPVTEAMWSKSRS